MASANNEVAASMMIEDVALLGFGPDGLKKGPWTTEEDAILTEYVTKNGEGNWNLVQKNTGLPRCGKSCRLRWANHLRPNLKKGAFSREEEAQVIKMHSEWGNKWARMATQMPGRTDNEIKNFWNTRIKRRIRAGLPLHSTNLILLPRETISSTEKNSKTKPSQGAVANAQTSQEFVNENSSSSSENERPGSINNDSQSSAILSRSSSCASISQKVESETQPGDKKRKRAKDKNLATKQQAKVCKNRKNQSCGNASLTPETESMPSNSLDFLNQILNLGDDSSNNSANSEAVVIDAQEQIPCFSEHEIFGANMVDTYPPFFLESPFVGETPYLSTMDENQIQDIELTSMLDFDSEITGALLEPLPELSSTPALDQVLSSALPALLPESQTLRSVSSSASEYSGSLSATEADIALWPWQNELSQGYLPSSGSENFDFFDSEVSPIDCSFDSLGLASLIWNENYALTLNESQARNSPTSHVWKLGSVPETCPVWGPHAGGASTQSSAPHARDSKPCANDKLPVQAFLQVMECLNPPQSIN